jgi:hypothetical protein
MAPALNETSQPSVRSAVARVWIWAWSAEHIVKKTINRNEVRTAWEGGVKVVHERYRRTGGLAKSLLNAT